MARSTVHVLLFDGSLASLAPGQGSVIGRIHGLLSDLPAGQVRLFYAPGQQWVSWRSLSHLANGQCLPDAITEGYGWLASRWRPGDRVYMFGYSRGAYAARSLAGMIGRVGLLRAEHAAERNLRLAWRWYQAGGQPRGLAAFRRRCHEAVPIRMIGAFDTVKSMGLRLPVLWQLTERRYAFHDHHLGPEVEIGRHALALDETRAVFRPVLWDSDGEVAGRVRQVWFRGCHADVGGQLCGMAAAQGLADLPLGWMLGEAEAAGLPLPEGWRGRLAPDARAPSVGSWRGMGKLCLARAPRVVGRDASEALHESVAQPYGGPAALCGEMAAAARPRRVGRRWRAAGAVVRGKPLS